MRERERGGREGGGREKEREYGITSTIFPPATTAIISASLIVLSLCAITNTVLPKLYKVKG